MEKEPEFAIILDRISKEYAGFNAVSEASFQVKKGSIHGFLGPNGAGKTTTLSMIAGLLKPTGGDIFVYGKKLKENLANLKTDIGILPENPPLYPDMKVKEYLYFVGRLNKMSNQYLKIRYEKIIQKLKLEEIQHRLIDHLSRGYKQKVGIAAAIIFNPKLVILDEPTLGLDPIAMVEMRNLINELRHDHTVILSSHLLNEVEQVCDEVTIIDKGLIKASGTIEEIKKSFQFRELIEIKVERCSESDLSVLRSYDFVDEVKYNNNTIQCLTSSTTDNRSVLSEKIIELKLGLIEFRSNPHELEDVFKQVTGKND